LGADGELARAVAEMDVHVGTRSHCSPPAAAALATVECPVDP
jgi:hypothetical protein